MNSDVIGADPYILYDEQSKVYYCYATGTSDNKSFIIYKSLDLINWEFVNYALDLNHPKIWGKDWFWAPECYYNPNNNHYYLFYSARLKDELTEKYFNNSGYLEACKIGVAVSKSPKGPFINISNEPLDFYPYDEDYLAIEDVCNNVFEIKGDNLLKKAPKGKHIPVIDVNLMFDDDKIFMYFSRSCYMNSRFDETTQKFIEESHVAGIELDTEWWYSKDASQMPKIKKEYYVFDETTQQRKDKFNTLINYEFDKQEWENYHINDYEKYNKLRKNRRWSEGSTTFVINEKNEKLYCLTYSCNFFGDKYYGVGIAFSKDPLNGFKKYKNNPIIVQDENVCSTGHGSVVYYKNEMYYFLHGRDEINNPRILYVTKLKINDNKVTHTELIKCNLIK